MGCLYSSMTSPYSLTFLVKQFLDKHALMGNGVDLNPISFWKITIQILKAFNLIHKMFSKLWIYFSGSSLFIVIILLGPNKHEISCSLCTLISLSLLLLYCQHSCWRPLGFILRELCCIAHFVHNYFIQHNIEEFYLKY